MGNLFNGIHSAVSPEYCVQRAARHGASVHTRNSETVQPIRKVSAILWADVVGCSRLKGNGERATIDDLIATWQLLASGVESRGGRLVDTVGDSMLADIPSALELL